MAVLDIIEKALGEAGAAMTDVVRTVERWRRSLRRRPRRNWGRTPRRPSVRFDNDGSATATIVEVRAPDQPGLAFTLSEALAELGLDITFAKIATAKALALDEVIGVSHVTGANDFLVHVVVRDADHLRDLAVSSFTSWPEVAHIETALIFEHVSKPGLPDLS